MNGTINLLPPQVKRTHHTVRLLRHLAAALAAGSMLLVLIWLGLLLYQQTIQVQVAAQETIIADLETQAGQYASLEQDIALINERVKTANQLTAGARDWRSIAAELANLTPPAVKLQTVTMTDQKDAVWTIQGAAANQREMLIFQKKLEASPLLARTAITTIALEAPDDPASPVQFSLTAEPEQKP